ncbi:MAG: zinc ribbon domain-containing protein [Ktedonobacterales bacterium]
MAGIRFCPNCGWQNDDTARMCGGCGVPLPSDPFPAQSERTVTMAVPPGTPATGYDSATVFAPAAAPAAPYWPAQPAAGAATRRAARRGGCARRALLTLLVLAVLLTCGVLSAWTLLIRPPLHAKMDGGIRSALNTLVDTVNARVAQLPPGASGTITVTAADLNAQLITQATARVPIHGVSLDFTDGGVDLNYALGNSQGRLFARLAASGGRLLAQAATVSGPLKLIESGDELQLSVEGALSRLDSALYIVGVRIIDHTLSIKVRAT